MLSENIANYSLKGMQKKNWITLNIDRIWKLNVYKDTKTIKRKWQIRQMYNMFYNNAQLKHKKFMLSFNISFNIWAEFYVKMYWR